VIGPSGYWYQTTVEGVDTPRIGDKCVLFLKEPSVDAELKGIRQVTNSGFGVFLVDADGVLHSTFRSVVHLAEDNVAKHYDGRPLPLLVADVAAVLSR
jgi:hypothetical protein